MKGQKAVDTSIEHGVYEAGLQHIFIYMAENMNTKQGEVNLTFVWNLGEDDKGEPILFYDGFCKLPRSNDGFPMMGGIKSKFYNRVSALYGEQFDPRGEIDWDIETEDEYNSPELLDTLPAWAKDMPDEMKVQVNTLKFAGQELIGKTCNIEIGHSQKPDGTMSDKTSVVHASPIAKKLSRKPVPQQPEKK